MNKSLTKVVAKYGLSTSKLIDLYYKEPFIKSLVHVMDKAIDIPEAYMVINRVLWIIEELSRSDFNVLVKAAEDEKLKDLFKVFSWVAKEV